MSGPSTSTTTLAGVEWTISYNCYRGQLGGWLSLDFHNEKENGEYVWIVKVAGILLKSRTKTPQDAAALAVRAAKIWSQKIIDEITKIEGN